MKADAIAAGESAATIAGMFADQARRCPDDPAVVFDGRALSYAELDRRAGRLAGRLSAEGVGRDVPVAICMDRSLEMVVGVLAVLQSGGGYVPVDPAYPRDRIDYMLGDCGAPIILTQPGRMGASPRGGARILPVDASELGAETGGRESLPPPQASPLSLTYLIYTSGSTGQPKGVAMPEAPLRDLLRWQLSTSVAGPGTRTLQFASLSFDVSFQEIFSTWCSGGTLVLLSETERRDARSLLRRIIEDRVERLFLPYIALQHLAEAAAAEKVPPRALREVVTAGEQLQITPAIRALFQDLPGCVLQNQYGPSETHVVTAWTLRGSPEDWPALPPIGHAVSTARVHLVTNGSGSAGTEEPGELYVGGTSVARGYWKRPDLTAERFVPDPFTRTPGGRLYRTGDVARVAADGEIEFLGRADSQVKIRGYRVEPGEVEVVLASIRGVRSCAVAVRSDLSGARHLVAYVVPASGKGGGSVKDLRAALQASLPEHMIPTRCLFIDRLPVTPSGKIDRKRLPDPDWNRPDEVGKYVAPRNDREQRLVEIWEKAFGLGRVGVRDDFFELGGHSLIAGRIFLEIQRRFDVNLSPTSLLQAPTIEKLADRLSEGIPQPRAGSLVPIQPAGGRAPFFCIHAGAGTVLFYYDLAKHLGPDQPVYGLQARGLYGEAAPHTRVEEMASAYVREIRAVQPQGPYRLAGFCFGAVLAFEMAGQLERAGQKVTFLGSFDGASPGYDLPASDENRPADAPSWGRRHAAVLSELSLREKASYVAKKARVRWRIAVSALAYRSRLLRYHVGEIYRRLGRGLPEPLRRNYFLVNHFRAERAYRPRPYGGSLTIFESQGLFRDRDLGWSPWVGALEIYEIPGNHRRHRDLMTGEFIESVTAHLKACLDRADRHAGTAA